LDSDEDMNLSLAILDAIEEDFHRVVKVARPKTKGRREMLNLVSSINYGDAKKKKKKKKKIRRCKRVLSAKERQGSRTVVLSVP
jgi:methyl coenzyme M reductase subunit C